MQNNLLLSRKKAVAQWACLTCLVSSVAGVWLWLGRPHAKPVTRAETPPVLLSESTMQDGTKCSAVLRQQQAGWGGLNITVGPRRVDLPGECLANLPAYEPGTSSVAFAESNRDTFVVLMGGRNTSRWRASLILREGAVVGREMDFGEGKPPEILQFQPPIQACSAAIPAEELERVRRAQMSEAGRGGGPRGGNGNGNGNGNDDNNDSNP